MGLSRYNFKYIQEICELKLKTKKRLDVLSLGYPDILLTKEEVRYFLDDEQISKLKLRDDGINIAALQNNEEYAHWCCESYSFFDMLGCELSVFDFTDWNSKEFIVDLNLAVPKKYHGKFDLIIDPATTEHIFNLPQAMINILNMAKVDGYIYHSTPFNDPNHGFFSISPTFYYDFYESNGAKVLKCTEQTRYGLDEINLPPREGFIKATKGVSSVVVHKQKECTAIVYPVQGKYKNSKMDNDKLNEIKNKFKNAKRIALVPYNANTRFIKKLFSEKQTKIYDDNDILNKYLDIEKLQEIIKVDYDAVLITSLTYEDKIRAKLISIGINHEKIYLQV